MKPTKSTVRYRRVSVQIWGDAKVMPLSDTAQLIFLFILTHPAMTSIGAMRGTIEGLAAEKRMQLKAFTKAFREVRAKALIAYDETACLIVAPNFLKHNPPQSPNVVRSWGKVVQTLPECNLLWQQLARVKECCEVLGEDFVEAFAYAFPKGIQEAFAQPSSNQEQEQEQDNLSRSPDGDPEGGGFDGPRPSGWSKRLEETFEEFWKAYPRKVAKGEARRVWARLRPSTYLENIHATLKLQCRSEQWRRDSGRFIPYPATWLNAAGWESTGIDKARLNGKDEQHTPVDLESVFDA